MPGCLPARPPAGRPHLHLTSKSTRFPSPKTMSLNTVPPSTLVWVLRGIRSYGSGSHGAGMRPAWAQQGGRLGWNGTECLAWPSLKVRSYLLGIVCPQFLAPTRRTSAALPPGSHQIHAVFCQQPDGVSGTCSGQGSRVQGLRARIYDGYIKHGFQRSGWLVSRQTVASPGLIQRAPRWCNRSAHGRSARERVRRSESGRQSVGTLWQPGHESVLADSLLRTGV